MVLSEVGSVAIPPPAQKTFDAEGEVLEHAFEEILPSSCPISRPTLLFNKSAANAPGQSDDFKREILLGQIIHETRLGPWHWMLKRATS